MSESTNKPTGATKSENESVATKLENEPAAGLEPRVAIMADNVHVRFDAFSVKTNAQGMAKRTLVEVEALSGVSFVLREGQTLGVLGLNGAGKSTLIGAISGKYATTKGQILVRSQPRTLSVGTALRATMTGRQNARLGLLELGVEPDAVEKGLEEIEVFAGLEGFYDMTVSTYSSGMKARLRFAISTQFPPKILLLDEALAVGDISFRDKSLQRLNAIREKAGAIIFVSHSAQAILEASDTVMWLEKGRIKMMGAPEDVVDYYREAKHGNKRAKVVKKRRAG